MKFVTFFYVFRLNRQMHCVKVEKIYNGNRKTKYLMVDGDTESVRNQVVEWCENDTDSQGFGYTYIYENVTDVDIVKKAVVEECNKLEKEIKVHTSKKNKLLTYLLDILRSSYHDKKQRS